MNASGKFFHFIVLAWFRLLTLLPLKVLFLFSEVLTFIVYRLVGYRKRVVFNNLQNSFPKQNNKQIKYVARKYFRHLSVMIVENMYLRFVSKKKFSSLLSVDDLALLEEFYKQGKNLIIMTGHFGNWEYGGLLTRHTKYMGAAVYKKLSSAVFDKIYFDIRSRLGVQPIEMQDVFRQVVKLNHENNPYILFMVADQSPMKNDQQHWISFLNQPTGAYLGSEKLAKKFDMPVLYMELKRNRKGSYKANLSLITDEPKNAQPHEITEKYYALLEQSIKQSPRFWLWSHKRWKHKPPKIIHS